MEDVQVPCPSHFLAMQGLVSAAVEQSLPEGLLEVIQLPAESHWPVLQTLPLLQGVPDWAKPWQFTQQPVKSSHFSLGSLMPLPQQSELGTGALQTPVEEAHEPGVKQEFGAVQVTGVLVQTPAVHL